MVSNGTWRDYSLSSDKRNFFFDVYKTTSDKPILRIAKNLCQKKKKKKYFNEKFLIKDKNGKIIKKSENLKLLIEKLTGEI